jgi:hypothetical protein
MNEWKILLLHQQQLYHKYNCEVFAKAKVSNFTIIMMHHAWSETEKRQIETLKNSL